MEAKVQMAWSRVKSGPASCPELAMLNFFLVIDGVESQNLMTPSRYIEQKVREKQMRKSEEVEENQLGRGC